MKKIAFTLTMALFAYSAVLFTALEASAQGYTVELKFSDDSTNQTIITNGTEDSFTWQIGRLRLNKKGFGNRSFAFEAQEMEGDQITARSPNSHFGSFDQNVFGDIEYPNFKGNEQIVPPASGQSFKFGHWYVSSRYRDQGLSCNITRCYSIGFVPDVSGITDLQAGQTFRSVFKTLNFECRGSETCAAASIHELSVTISRTIPDGSIVARIAEESTESGVLEDESTSVKVILESASTSNSITVGYTITDISATTAEDYTEPTMKSVTFNAGGCNI